MKNDVGLAKESVFMLIVLLLILRKFLVVAGNTAKTIGWPSYNCKGWKPDAVYVYSGVCGTCGLIVQKHLNRWKLHITIILYYEGSGTSL